MSKLLKTQDILLLGLAGLLDVFQEVRDPAGILSRGYEEMYGFVPAKYKRKNFGHLVWRNLKTNYIEKVVKNGEVFLRLTPQGSSKITRDFPLIIKKDQKWDRKWRLVFFDISEIHKIQRDGLREKLIELGFGMLQKSIFITPHNFTSDLIEFLGSVGLIDFVYVVEISNNAILSKDMKQVANKVWKLDLLNERYQEILGEIIELRVTHLTESSDRTKSLNIQMDKDKAGKNIEKVDIKGQLVKKKGSKGDDRNRNLERQKSDFNKRINQLHNKYLQVLMEDPMLPNELLPKDWLRSKVSISLKELRK